MIKYVLDTSALLAHYLREPGAEEVNRILSQGPTEVGVSVVALPEFQTRLLELVTNTQEQEGVFSSYIDVLSTVLPANRVTAGFAIQLRSIVKPRLPLVDALIAAAAKEYNATLIHRDPHMAAIPVSFLKQQMLPQKT